MAGNPLTHLAPLRGAHRPILEALATKADGAAHPAELPHGDGRARRARLAVAGDSGPVNYSCIVLHTHTVRRAMNAQPVEPVAIPRVNGRNQDKSLARARKQRAIELRMTGMTYQAIADEIGYQNAGSVYTIIKQAQTKTTAAAVEDPRQLELDRLDATDSAAPSGPPSRSPHRPDPAGRPASAHPQTPGPTGDDPRPASSTQHEAYRQTTPV